MTKRLLLIDHNALLHRCRNALLRSGRRYTTADGTPTTGVFSYINCVLSIVKSLEPSHVVICYDAGGNARKSESDTYKANRGPLDSDFITENNILRDEAFYAMGIESIGFRGIEADDILYTLSHIAQFGTDRFDEVIIATVDQDLLQCVTERCAVLLWNSAKKQQLMWVPDVLDKWNCEPDDIRFIKAISGDASDNVIGVKGVGPKTAVKIMAEADWDFEKALEHKKLAEHREHIMSNLDLVTLRNIVSTLGPVDWSYHTLGLGMKSDYTSFLEKYELSSLQKRFKATAEMLGLK